MNLQKYMSVLLALLLIAAPGAFAATVSNTVTVPVVLNIPESISLTLSTNNIVLSNAATSANVTLTAGWQVIPNTHTTATIYAFFSSLPTLSGGSSNISADHFSTQYNGGASVVCNQGAFGAVVNGVQIGHASQNCGTFSFPNIATNTNDSQAVVLTLAANASVFNGGQAVGSYTGGVLNIVFQIV